MVGRDKMKEKDNAKKSDSSKKWRWGLIVASIAVLLAMNTKIGLHHKPNRCNKVRPLSLSLSLSLSLNVLLLS